MERTLAVAAVDLGASSGRVMLGEVADGRITLTAAHRFENRLEPREGYLSWDVDTLWSEIRTGLRRAATLAREHGLPGIAAIGVDSWAVDYVLVGPDGTRIGEAISYRDDRTDAAADLVAAQMDPAAQYAAAGIAQQPFNTIHQLAVEHRLGSAPAGTTALLIPDHLGFLLTGERRTEVTNASTTGLLAADTQQWDAGLLAAAGVDASLFAPLIAPGDTLGQVLPDLAAELELGEQSTIPVIAVGSHDTASAVLAVPAESESAPVAYLSSGTWSLIGLELPHPIPTEQAREAGFTNEAGVGGTTRFLKNVMGMWLISESQRQWAEHGDPHDLPILLAAAADEEPGRYLIDATSPEFLPPGSMADRITTAAGAESLSPVQVVRCVVDSLALAYRDALDQACTIAGVARPTALHVVGGGSQNRLLNQLTADATGIPVIAGPVEATAIGNVAVLARALGVIGPSAREARAAIRASSEVEEFLPRR
jgi:rhamnulokinase